MTIDEFISELSLMKGSFEINKQGEIRSTIYKSYYNMPSCPLNALCKRKCNQLWSNGDIRFMANTLEMRHKDAFAIVGAADNTDSDDCQLLRKRICEILGL